MEVPPLLNIWIYASLSGSHNQISSKGIPPWCGLSDNFLSGMIEGSSEHDTLVISLSNNLPWLFETKLSPRIAADSMNVSATK
jgi:hypothetical protein